MRVWGWGIQYEVMNSEIEEVSKVSKPAVIFVLILLVLLVVWLGRGRQGSSEWDAAANAPSESVGLSGVSEEERYNLKAAGKTPSETIGVSAEEQQAFLDAANAPAQ